MGEEGACHGLPPFLLLPFMFHPGPNPLDGVGTFRAGLHHSLSHMSVVSANARTDYTKRYVLLIS
jgi:hypothetical protein